MRLCIKTPPMHMEIVSVGIRSVENLPSAAAHRVDAAFPPFGDAHPNVVLQFLVPVVAGAGSKPLPACAPLHLVVEGIDPESGAVLVDTASIKEFRGGEGSEHNFAGPEEAQNSLPFDIFRRSCSPETDVEVVGFGWHTGSAEMQCAPDFVQMRDAGG